MEEKSSTNPFDQINERLDQIESAITAFAQKEERKTEKRFYSVAEAAQKLCVAAITIYRGVEAGRIPHKRVGGRVMIPGSFLEA